MRGVERVRQRRNNPPPVNRNRFGAQGFMNGQRFINGPGFQNQGGRPDNLLEGFGPQVGDNPMRPADAAPPIICTLIDGVFDRLYESICDVCGDERMCNRRMNQVNRRNMRGNCNRMNRRRR